MHISMPTQVLHRSNLQPLRHLIMIPGTALFVSRTVISQIVAQ